MSWSNLPPGASEFDPEINPPCYCIGPQNGEPLCPCKMRSFRVYQHNGRWIKPGSDKDLGPVLKKPEDI